MRNKLHIDYSLLGKAISFYQSIGYTLIDVNWMVDPKFSLATWNSNNGQFKTTNQYGDVKHLVGSAEQGFIENAAMGQIEYGKKYVSVTPCFRSGDNKTPLNLEWFMKVELSVMTNLDDTDMFLNLLEDARHCFIKLGAHENKLSVVQTDEYNLDILHKFNHIDYSVSEIELGSYGCRELLFNNTDRKGLINDSFVVHYGTGLALPRFQLIG